MTLWQRLCCRLGFHGDTQIVSTSKFTGAIRCMRCGRDLCDV